MRHIAARRVGLDWRRLGRMIGCGSSGCQKMNRKYHDGFKVRMCRI